MTLAVIGDSIVNYEYDHAGLRTAKIIDGRRTELINNGSNVVAELSEGEIRNYYRGISLIGFEDEGEYYYYKLNAHGDTIGILDAFGQQVKEYSYDAYGKQEYTDKFDTNPFRYCGEYYDNETGLIYLRARYYDPSTQRFVSEDPIRNGFNWYAYCGNNPVIYRDSTGMWQESDEKFSTSVQSQLLQLTVSWYVADTQEAKNEIHEQAEKIRNFYNNGLGSFLDMTKTITGAAADEFSWFLGGDTGRAERDYWLNEAGKYQSIKISEKQELQAIMFIASIGAPSIDDAWKFISEKASKEMIETVGEKGAKKFLKATLKQAGKTGANGIKKLSGKGIKGYMYEAKVVGKTLGSYRLLGNINEAGEIIWEAFVKTHK